MRFTLTYGGRLPVQSKNNCRVDVKHDIRTQLHKQLAELWDERPALRRSLDYYKHMRGVGLGKLPPTPVQSATEQLIDLGAKVERRIANVAEDTERGIRAARGHPMRSPVRFPSRLTDEAGQRGIVLPYQRGAFTFLPLASKHFHLVCELDILFLRVEEPGTLFTNRAGDLDNRLKVLFDALRLPKQSEIPPTAEPAADQDPFFCLLEDDSLITAFRVESERLLVQPEDSTRVQLVIRVTMRTRRVTLVTLELEGD